MRLHRAPIAKPYLEGREVAFFSPNLNERDFRVSFAPADRLFTSWEQLSRTRCQTSCSHLDRVFPTAPLQILTDMFYRRFGKRVFDIVLAVLALAILSPLLCLISLLVKLTSRGRVFYVQERISGRPPSRFGSSSFAR